MKTTAYVLVVDPGREKTGIAILSSESTLLMMDIVPTLSIEKELESLVTMYPSVQYLICGDGTNHRAVGDIVRDVAVKKGKSFSYMNESHTTEEARKRYFEVHRPRGWRRLIPRGMLYPPVPVDDITAWIIGERWLVTHKETVIK